MSDFNDDFVFTLNGDIIINEDDDPELIIDKLISDDDYKNIERGSSMLCARLIFKNLPHNYRSGA